jgi:acyl transferase domain-containing protein
VRSQRPGTTVGGFLADVTSCEAEEFGLTDDEAAATDPQERLLLATTRRCVEDAGVTPERLSGAGPVGVFVGAMWADSALYGVAARADGAPGTYANRAGLAHRISHAFDLTGPSVVIDNGCVSGLAAFDAALRAVRSRQCAAAVVGAGNLVLHPDHLDVLATLGLVAEETGSCPLTERASGWIVGEGIGAALLKPLADAVADGDTIHAVIRGGAVRHTGGTRQFGLPSRATQEATLRAALADAALDPPAVGYVEAAAAGAALGDSIELAAVASVFAGDDPVLLGSVKPVVGHLEAASVFAQLARVICQFRSGRVHPTLPAAAPAAIRVTSPVRLVTESTPWPARPDRVGSVRRRAVINAVAGTGAYGCLVVEEPPPPTPPEPGDDPAAVRVLPLSADTPQHLVALALAIADHVETTAGAVPLGAVARTLRQGRRARAHRGVVAATPGDAPRLLRELAVRLDTGQPPLLGPVPQPYAEVVSRWLAGAEVSWPDEPPGPRTPLPPTPLRTRRFWPPGNRDPDGDPFDRFSRIVSAETGIDPDRLTAQSDLLALGVTSRQLQRIATRVRAAGGGPLPLERLFEIDNLAELAGTAFGGVR